MNSKIEGTFFDLHIHSSFSFRCSKKLTFENIIKKAQNVGLTLIGSGDILHPGWRSEIEKNINSVKLINIILTAQIIDCHNAHHILIFPSFYSVEVIYNIFKKYSNTLDTHGRPYIKLTGYQIIKFCIPLKILLGPAHCSSPKTSVFGRYRSFKNCYKELLPHVKFFEIGLDSNINSLEYKINPFLKGFSFSDAHSLESIGREFTYTDFNIFDFSSFNEFLNKKSVLIKNYKTPRGYGKYFSKRCLKCFKYAKKTIKIPKHKCNLISSVYSRIKNYDSEYNTFTDHKNITVTFICKNKFIIIFKELKNLNLEKYTDIYFFNNYKLILKSIIPKDRLLYFINSLEKNSLLSISGGGGIYGKFKKF